MTVDRSCVNAPCRMARVPRHRVRAANRGGDRAAGCAEVPVSSSLGFVAPPFIVFISQARRVARAPRLTSPAIARRIALWCELKRCSRRKRRRRELRYCDPPCRVCSRSQPRHPRRRLPRSGTARREQQIAPYIAFSSWPSAGRNFRSPAQAKNLKRVERSSISSSASAHRAYDEDGARSFEVAGHRAERLCSTCIATKPTIVSRPQTLAAETQPGRTPRNRLAPHLDAQHGHLLRLQAAAAVVKRMCTPRQSAVNSAASRTILSETARHDAVPACSRARINGRSSTTV